MEDDATLPYPSSENSLADDDESIQDNYTVAEVKVEMKSEENKGGNQVCSFSSGNIINFNVNLVYYYYY